MLLQQNANGASEITGTLTQNNIQGDFTMDKKNNFLELLCLPLIAITANLVMHFTGFLSYYLNNVIGFSVVLAGSFVTIFRIWDAITDVGMGNIADKTNTRFGKFTPYVLIGGIGTIVTGQIMVNLPPMLPEGTVRKVVFVLLYLLFVVFTTMQVSSLRSTAQVCIKNGKQRATYGMMNGIYLAIFYSVANIFVYSRLMPATKGFNLQFFKTLITVYTCIGFVCLLIYLMFYYKYDRIAASQVSETKAEKINLADAIHLFKNNIPFRMLIFSAGTDKLATTLQGNATVVVIMFGIAVGNAKLNSAVNSYTMIPSIIMILIGLGAIGRKYGAKKALLLSSWGGVVTSILSILLWIFGNYKTLNFPGYDGFAGWSFFTIAYLALFLIMKGFNMIGSNVINPMLADVIDYEYYRSGKYCPGTIGALFNLADKVISSLGPTVIAILCAMIGFRGFLPTAEDPFSIPLFAIGILGLYGFSLIGLIVNIICMKFYNLTPEYMKEIRVELDKREGKH